MSSSINSNNNNNSPNNVQFMLTDNSRSSSKSSLIISSAPIQIGHSASLVNLKDAKLAISESNFEVLSHNSNSDKQVLLLSSSDSSTSSASSESSNSSTSSFVSASVQPFKHSDTISNDFEADTNNLKEAVSNPQINNSPETLKKGLFNSPSFKESSSYKIQKENYLTEKKRITNDILTIMRDERIIVLADWLKVRGSLKNWIKLYVILKPGIMLLFKSDKMKPGQWVGTIILNSCQLLERPSKKHGFCFKLFHPLERSIWASKGPSGETYINVPYMLLPTFYLIFRAPSEKVGNIWMEAIELSLKSSHLTKPNGSLAAASTSCLNDSFRSNNSERASTSKLNNDVNSRLKINCKDNLNDSITTIQTLNQQQQNETDIENKHFREISDREEAQCSDSDNCKNSSDELCSLNSSLNNLDDEYFSNENSTSNTNDDSSQLIDELVLAKSKINLSKKGSKKNDYSDDREDAQLEKETRYAASPNEEFGELGNKGQTEEVGEENRSLIFCLVKQVRPGMDLSKVVLPTFILEPRSFLEKLTDFYYHSDILAESINNDDPFERMKSVVKFYLSGFYKKPKGLKKPYNPILGEVFRSHWYNPKTDSKTFYIAEQVSHHPPITSFYVSNRKEGFCIYGTILARSKFYGNSVSAIMDGSAKVLLLNRGEEYVISLPYANCKGILIGKLTMELGGKVTIECAKTGYSTEIDFKLKPLLGGIEASNLIEGKIKFAKETVAVLSGKWDGEIIMQEKRGEQKQILFWHPNSQIIESRLKRYIVPIEEQREFESEKLWTSVSDAIKNCDQHLATEEKTKVELKQREEELDRRSKFIEYKSKLFSYDSLSKEWIYNYSDLRPWDAQTDFYQFESDFKILTKTKHNLKVQTRISDPRTSILSSLRQHQTPRLRNRLVSNVVESTECILSAPNNNDLLDQYNDIKQRLDQIEESLKNLNNNVECNNKAICNKERQTQLKSLKKNNHFLTSMIIAWLIGIFTAFLFRYLF